MSAAAGRGSARSIGEPAVRVGLAATLAADAAALSVGLEINVDVPRDALQDLRARRQPELAAKAWNSWYRKALRGGIEPLGRFARAPRLDLPGILAHCRYPLGTNLIEGIDNKSKVIQRMAYGFRDDAYFLLKIRAAFRGVG